MNAFVSCWRWWMCLVATLEFEWGLNLYPQIQYYIGTSSLSTNWKWPSNVLRHFHSLLLVTNELLHLDFSKFLCAFQTILIGDFYIWYWIPGVRECGQSPECIAHFDLNHFVFQVGLLPVFEHFCVLYFWQSWEVSTPFEIILQLVCLIAMWLHILNFAYWCPASNSHSDGVLRLISSNYGSHGLA